MLKARLYEHEIQKKDEENQKQMDTKTDIGWVIKLDRMYFNHTNS